MNFHLQFSRLFFYFGEILYNILAHNTIQNFYFRENRHKEGRTFHVSVKQITFHRVP
jgi:hypothetical protein